MAAMGNEDYVSGYTFDDVQRMACDVLKHSPIRPTVGVICGTGLQGLVEAVENVTSVPYSSIPGFPACTAKGHLGKFVIGTIGDKSVLLMVGRFHYYEGYPIWKVGMPVRVMKAIGIDTLIVTNAAGGLNPDYKCGDIMVIKDHIDLPGLVGINVLRGKHDDRFGPRFVATNAIYDAGLRHQFQAVAREMGLSDRIQEGVYVMESGPTFITLMESRLLRMIGGDVTGMSTLPETVVGQQCGMKVFAFSFITDMETQEEDKKVELTHEEVLRMAKEHSAILPDLVKAFITSI